MEGLSPFHRLERELLAAVGGRFTLFHLLAVLAGLATTLGLGLGWAVGRFGPFGGPAIAVVLGVLVYWATFCGLLLAGGGVLGLALLLCVYRSSDDSTPPPAPSRSPEHEPAQGGDEGRA